MWKILILIHYCSAKNKPFQQLFTRKGNLISGCPTWFSFDIFQTFLFYPIIVGFLIKGLYYWHEVSENFKPDPEGGTAIVDCDREPTKSGTLPLIQVGFPQSNGGWSEAKSQNIADPPGSNQFYIPVRSQLTYQIYHSYISLAIGWLAQQDWGSLIPQRYPRFWLNLTAQL